jgi:ribonucleoside-diphosphate reductase alpha chain
MGLLAVDLSNRISELQPVSKKALPANQRKGVSFPKYFTQKLESGKTPYDEIAWELRTAAIASDKGAIIFEQDEVEVPAEWSQTATNIVVSKYFYGKMGSPERERSVRQLVHRVVDTIADWGAYGRYFKTRDDAENFRNELAHLMLTQKACFNSPVWFNVGVQEPRGYGYYYDEASDNIVKLKKGESKPQCSACFINSVKDSLESILDLAKTEGMLFKWGSGSGTNLSPLREEGGGLGSSQLHEGLRCVRRSDQVWWKDAARGENGDPECGSPGHPIVHLVQGQGREEGAHADRRGLRCRYRWRRVWLHLLPERQQFGARH